MTRRKVGSVNMEDVQQLREELFGDCLTADQVCEVLDLEKTTVLRYLRDRVLIGFQIGRRWYVPTDSIVQFRADRLAAARRKEGEA